MSPQHGIDIATLIGNWPAAERAWLDAAVIRERTLRNASTTLTRERWKYTPLAGMAARFDELDPNTVWSPGSSQQAGVRVVPLSELAGEDVALCRGMLDGGLDADRHLLADLALLRAASGLLIDIEQTPVDPIELDHITRGADVVMIVVRPGVHATIVERHRSNGFQAALMLVDVARDAQLTHARDASTSSAGIWSLTQVRVHDAAGYTLNQHARGGARARLETHVVLAGRGAATNLVGAALVDADEHLDQQMVVEHEAPDTRSQQRFHVIGAGKGRSVFNGRIHIHPRANRSDAWLSNRNLALHADAELYTRPELEIYTDDVRCAHGATVGQLDADALFLLLARGIPETAARNMLAHAFLRECITGPLANEAVIHLLDQLGGQLVGHVAVPDHAEDR